MRVAVAGAGPAGLAAAFRLARAGARVTVFESRGRVGGRTFTDEVGGVRIDAGVQLFSSAFRSFLRLLREAGGDGLSAEAPGRDALWRGGKAHEVVYGSPTSMLASGALPFTLKLRLGAHYLPFLSRHAESLRMDALELAAGAGLDRESIARWGERELGRDFVDLLAHPLLATLYGLAAEEASAGFYHALARQGTHMQVLALRGGAAAFCGLLARAVGLSGGEVRLDAPVRAVRADGAGVEVAGDAGSERFDAAVVAVPAPAARELAGGWMPALADWLAGVAVRPTATLGLVTDRPLGVRWFGLSFARGESRAAAAVCALEAKPAALVPPGRGALVVFPLPDAGARWLGLAPEEALRAALPDLAKPFPRIESMLQAVRLYPWPHGWTLFRPGSLEHLARFRAGGLETDPRVAFAGDYLYAPTVEGAVTAGLRAAERILSRAQAAAG